MIEIWRTAIYDGEIYEGLYQVSNFGRVKSLITDKHRRKRLMKPSKDRGGYLKVCLSKNKEKKRCKVHRLVAQTFLPNPENKPCVNHKIEGDEGKTMNMVIFNEDGTIDEERTTIEWATYEENNNYGTRNERSAKTQSKTVLQLSLTGELIREWKSTHECGRNGFNRGNVCQCCNNKRNSHKGYIWKYKE